MCLSTLRFGARDTPPKGTDLAGVGILVCTVAGLGVELGANLGVLVLALLLLVGVVGCGFGVGLAAGRFALNPSRPTNEMGFKLLYYRIWIPDVFWVGGPLTRGTKGAGIRYKLQKNIPNPDFAPF